MDSWHGTLATEQDRRRAIWDAVFASLGHLVIATDEHGTILDMNPAAERALGYSRAEVVGRATPMLFHDRQEVEQAAERLSREMGQRIDPGVEVFVARARRGIRVEQEWTYIRKDGSRFAVLLDVGALRNGAGALVGFFGISSDLTDRKASERAAIAMQAEVLARKEAERANLSKSKFLAAASHDLRQPLQSAVLFAAALAPSITDAHGRRMMANLDKSLEGMRTLLDRLLDISKLDAGAVQPRPVDFQIAGLLDELNAIYTPRAAAKGLDWRLVPCDAAVHSDPDLLGRILRNLIENALTYTLEGGVEVSGAAGADAVTITVRDSGIGIPEDKLEDVFQEFTQLGNPERDRNQGLGLGLAIVRRLSRLIGHPVEVRSRFGVGSEFVVTVPLATGTAPRPEPAAISDAVDGDGRLILLVEDDALVRAGLVAMVEGWGYATLDAGSWEEADAVLSTSSRPPDAVIADYRLRNGVTGLSVLNALRDLYDAPVRAILLTGETGAAPVAEAKALGCAVLHKPVTACMLRDALADLFRTTGQ
ncbi:hybrid sensor histidine kinase/response regulator [Azospirillum sp. sgz302134]